MYRLLQTENLVIIDKLIHEQIIQSSFVNQLNWFTEKIWLKRMNHSQFGHHTYSHELVLNNDLNSGLLSHKSRVGLNLYDFVLWNIILAILLI